MELDRLIHKLECNKQELAKNKRAIQMDEVYILKYLKELKALRSEVVALREYAEISNYNIENDAWGMLLSEMSDLTSDDKKSASEYLDSQSNKTGINVEDLFDYEDGN